MPLITPSAVGRAGSISPFKRRTAETGTVPEIVQVRSGRAELASTGYRSWALLTPQSQVDLWPKKGQKQGAGKCLTGVWLQCPMKGNVLLYPPLSVALHGMPARVCGLLSARCPIASNSTQHERVAGPGIL